MTLSQSKQVVTPRRHGEGRLDLEQLYAMVLPSAHKTATTEHGRSLLNRLVGSFLWNSGTDNSLHT